MMRVGKIQENLIGVASTQQPPPPPPDTDTHTHTHTPTPPLYARGLRKINSRRDNSEYFLSDKKEYHFHVLSLFSSGLFAKLPI